MEKIGKMAKENKGDSFLFDKSYDDGEGCIHIPVYMPKIKNRPDVDTDFENSVIDGVMKKHKKNWTGKWETVSSEGRIKEYLFYY